MTINSGATLTADRLQLAQDAGSTGTLNLNDGGTLIVSDTTDTAVSSGGGTATFNFAGGTLKSNGSNSLTVTSNATLAAGTTSTIDTDGQTGTVSGILSGAGSLTKSGSGTLILSGTNTYTGATTLSAGSLLINGSTANSAFTINAGTLGGAGTVGALTVNSGGTLAPGNSPGIVNVTGNLILNSGSIIAMELAGAGGTPGTDFDQIAVTGTMTAGGTLNVTALNDFTPAVGQSFQLFNASSIGGTFSAINLPTLSGATWNTTALYTSGTLSVVTSAVPEPASAAILLALLALGFTTTRRPRRIETTLQ